MVGDDVSMLHGVTLGGTSAERVDRHPKIGRGVLLGAGAKVIGNITIGDYAKIAAGAVVLQAGAARLHRGRRAGAPGQLPDLRRARPRPWTRPWPDVGLRLRHLSRGLRAAANAR